MLSEILRETLESRKMSLQALSDLSGVPIETLRNIYYNKVKDPKVSTILDISLALGVTVNFLMGKSLYNEDEIEIIRNYRKCGIHGKGIIKITSKFESVAAHKERSSSKKHRIPCIIPIGRVTDGIAYNSCEVCDVYTTAKHAQLAIEITTNYFAPAYCKGDRVLFEYRFPDNKERAVFTDGEKCYFRIFTEENDGYCLKCLNGHGKDIHLKRMDEMECIGTCVGVMRA